MRMAPFYRVRRVRCLTAPAGLVWPRGRVRRVDLQLVDLDLGEGEAIYDRLEELFTSEEGSGVSPNRRFGGFELRRGWRPLRTTVLRVHDVDRIWDACAPRTTEKPNARLASEGLRFRLSTQQLEGGDLSAPYEVNLALDGAVELRGCGGPTFSVRLEYVEEDPALDRALSEVAHRAPHVPPWVRALLRAQALFNARYFAGAHETARTVLAEVPNEPHAVALVYATYVEAGLAISQRGGRFGDGVLETIQRDRKRDQTTCELDRGDPSRLR